jgi:hypothetical protein
LIDRAGIPINKFVTIEKIDSIPTLLNAYRGYNVYFGVATRRYGDLSKDGINEIPCLWVDIDFTDKSGVDIPNKEEITQRLKDFPLKPSFLINSGGGIHAYWILKTPFLKSDIPLAENLLKRVAFYFGADKSSTDASHNLRIPGTWNFKPKYKTPRKVTIEEFHPENEYSPDDFEAFLPQAEEPYHSTGEERYYRQETNERLNQIMECEFLKHCNCDRATLSEPEWYAMVSILARETGGPNLIHSLSRGYPKYSPGETNKKIIHALNDTGPATCERIKTLWNCGKDCGVKSPSVLAFRTKEGESTNYFADNKSSEGLKLTYPTSHLKNFDLLDKSLGLFGEDYIPIAKACWYHLIGQALREVIIFGGIKTDLRFPVAFILPSGHGKLNILNLIDKTGQGMGDHISNPTSYHPEQLIGKVIRIENKKETKYRQVKGHFDSDVVIFDDGIDLIKSKDPVYKESRRYLCKCLDVIGENLMTKKPVDIPKEEALKYHPKCSIILFFQPFSLPEESFLDGVFRRFPIHYMNFDERDFSQEFEQRLEEGSTEDQVKELAEYLLEVRKDTKHPVTFSKDFKESFKKHHSLLINFGRTFGPKASNFTGMMVFTLQNWLLKMSVILARSEKRTEVNEWDVKRTFVDLLEILDSTFRFVEKKVQGKLDYGESWAGAIGSDRSVLEWLALKGATSEEKSGVTINEYEKKIRELTGNSESGARKIYNRHRKKRWIESRQRQQTTRVWLAFKPPEESVYDSLGDLGDPVTLAYQEIVKRIESERKNVERG